MPVLPLNGYVSPVNVDPVLLPPEIEVDAIAGPVTKTAVITSASGTERRKAQILNPIRQYTIAFGPEYVEDVLALFLCQLGPRFGFMLQAPADMSAADVLLPWTTSNGVTLAQLTKVYATVNYFNATVVRAVERAITLPDPATITVKVNGSLDNTWTLLHGGVLSFPHVLNPTDEVTATFNFFVPVRFADDQLEITLHTQTTQSLQQAKLLEILPGSPA